MTTASLMGSPKKPGTQARTSALTARRRPGVAARWMAQPRRKTHATVWVRKTWFCSGPIPSRSNRKASARPSRATANANPSRRSRRRTAGIDRNSASTISSCTRASMNQ